MQETGSKDGQRIAKLLARAGIASRREIERMIGEGRVALNGVPLTTAATMLPSLHGVTVDGEPVKEPAPARLYLFHKPTGVLTTATDPAGRQTIYDRLPKDLPRLVPVGRLDLNTEGLLLLTSDGELKRQLELPSTGIPRTYRARAYGQISQEQLEDLIEGIEIDGIRYGSIDANLERRTGANVWVELTLTEGKNREVRRVLEHLGLQVSRLIRTRYGPFVLGDLPPGAVGEVRRADLVAFRQSLARGNKGQDATIAVAPPAPPPRPQAEDSAPRRPASEPDRPRRLARPTGKPASAPKDRPAEAFGTSRPRGDARQGRPERDASAGGRARPERIRAEPEALETRRPRQMADPRATVRGRDAPEARPSRPERVRAAPEALETRRSRKPTGPAAAPRPPRPVMAHNRSEPPEARTPRPERTRAEPQRPDPRLSVDEGTPRPPRPKKGAGWAKAKPKARPAKPRRPRS